MHRSKCTCMKINHVKSIIKKSLRFNPIWFPFSVSFFFGTEQLSLLLSLSVAWSKKQQQCTRLLMHQHISRWSILMFTCVYASMPEHEQQRVEDAKRLEEKFPLLCTCASRCIFKTGNFNSHLEWKVSQHIFAHTRSEIRGQMKDFHS